MTVDSVIRKSIDAVAIVAYFNLNDEIYIYLRSCLRPALGFADFGTRPELNSEYLHNLFEVPAGLVDEHEKGYDGLISAAQRELHEEIGIKVDKDSIKSLGPRYFSSAGMCAERIFFFEVLVDSSDIGTPLEDGSPLERGGIIYAIPLKEALIELEDGNIIDAKTQMGLMRLAQKFRM